MKRFWAILAVVIVIAIMCGWTLAAANEEASLSTRRAVCDKLADKDIFIGDYYSREKVKELIRSEDDLLTVVLRNEWLDSNEIAAIKETTSEITTWTVLTSWFDWK